MSWSDLQQLDNETRLLLLLHARATSARRRLETIFDLSALLAKPSDQVRREYLIGLVNEGYPDEPDRRAALLESLTIKG